MAAKHAQSFPNVLQKMLEASLDLYGKDLMLKEFQQNENNFRTCEHRCVIVSVICYFGRNFEVLHVSSVPNKITQIPYKSHITLPYKHSKLAEIAKL